MNDVTLLDVQTTALLQRLAREQEERVNQLRAEARRQAADVVGRARAEARSRVHLAVVEARQALASAQARHEAARQTQRRQRRQALLKQLLDASWQRLAPALAQHWNDTTTRAVWCRAACAEALRALLSQQGFVVELDATCCDEVAPTVRACLAGRGDLQHEMKAVEALGPGLRLRAGRACIDATVAGLLASRERVAAALLAELDGDLPSTTGGGAT